MSITREFTIPLYAEMSMPVWINVNQFDRGETWIFTILDEGGQQYTPTTGAIIGIKSDGHIIANSGTVDSSGRVVITETEQMTASAGQAIFELVIDNSTHGTANFIVNVEPRPGENGIQSESDLSLFQEAIDAAATIGDVTDLVDDVAVLSSRMDEFTTLTDGSTTGDAELADIRVGEDSMVYPNAGDAVRGQVGIIESIIEADQSIYADKVDYQWVTSASYPTGFRTGYYDATGTAQSSSNRLRYQYQLTNNVESQYMWVFTCPSNRAIRISEFNASGTFVKNYGTIATYQTVTTGSKTVVIKPILGYKYAVTVQLDVTGITNSDITSDMVSGIHMYRFRNTLYSWARSNKVIYESGSFASGKATERLRIYIPSSVGYLRYDMYHFVDTSNNSNCWQLYHIYHVDENLENQIDLTITGEYECAIHLDGRNDFSGGHTHGDEVATNVVLLLDGKPTTISSLTDITNFNELRIIETSALYDPADSVTVIADHGREYIFSKENLTLNQSVKWKVAETLTNCYLAMFLPSKNRIDRASANCDYEELVLPSTTTDPLTTITKQKANSVTMWDTGNGFSAQISVPVYPTGLTGGDMISLSDNGGGDYNKLYFKVCGGGTSTVGELWKSTTVYKLDYAD